jgi:hypothetical protein
MNPTKNLIERKLYMNPPKNLIEPKLYMNLTKNLIEPKLYMNPTKNLIEDKLHRVHVKFSSQVFSGVHVKFKFYQILLGFM